jgi:Chromo (CHRromatin Organisation MOdifier) domain
MRDFITEYMKGCATCQMNKVNTHPTKPPLYPITPVAEARPFQTVALDFIVKLPESDGYNTILTITDHDCSKAALFIPCNETIDSEGVAKLYASHVVPHYGLPRKIISDQDPRFTSNFTTELCRILGVKQNISTAYHPQTDGQSEQTNQSLEQYLRMVCANDQHSWAEWLPLAQYTRNSWPSSMTKKTPYELILGYTPHIHQPMRATTVPGVTTRLQQIKDHRTAAQEALQRAQDHMTKETKYRPFKEGERVWLEGTHLKLPYETMKLAPRRYGPFHITAKVSDVVYRIKIPDKWKIHNIFHASLLTPYKETEKHGLNFLEPPPDLIDGEEEWEVEEILGDRQYRRKKQYLVQWKGYAPAHDSWVDESELHAPDLVEAYRRKNTKKTLTKLAQLTTAEIPQPAQIPHYQSRVAEIPHDQSSSALHQSATAKVPQDQSSSAPHQSAMAEITHDQSSREVGLQKYYDSLSIRTLRFGDEETSSPSLLSTGETTTLPQKEEARSSGPSLHCCPLPELPPALSRDPDTGKTVRPPATTPDIPIHNPRFPRVLPRSPSAYIFRPLPPALVLLSREVLSVPRQTVSQPARTREPSLPSVPPLCLPCPSLQPPYRETNRASETQQQPTPTTLQMTSTPDRHDTESPALSYLEPTVVHGSRDSSQAGSPGPRSARPATPYYNTGSECGDSDNDKENRRTTVYDLSSGDFAFVYKYTKAAHLFFRTTRGWPLGLGSFSFDVLDIAHRRLCPEHANDLDGHDNADWASVYHTLKAAQGQLEIFASAVPATQKEIQEQEATIIEVINMESIGGPESPHSERLG